MPCCSAFTQLYGKFPNMDLVLAVDVEKPPVATISPGGIAASIPGQIAVYARDNGTQHYAFTLGLVCACVCRVRATYMCVSACFASVLLCLVSWCVPTQHTTPHCLSSCTELTLFLVYNTTSMYCPNLWCTAQHAPCAQMSPPFTFDPTPVHSHGSLFLCR